MIANNFSGLSIEKSNFLFNNDDNAIINYIDGWICYSLCLREMKRNKLNWSDRNHFINKYLIKIKFKSTKN